MGLPRVGHIDFLNCLPLTYSYQQENFSRGLQLSMADPATLNQLIVGRQLDVSPVSSIIYAQNSEKFFLLPDVCIRADGPVQSIVLIAKKPISELAGDTIVLTAKSATSHCLLKIIMEKSYGVRPRYTIRHIDVQNALQNDAAAALLIGDDALYVHHHQEPGLYYYDIGAEWKKLTGLCMVYAVWVVGRDFARQQPAWLPLLYQRIVGGFQNGYLKKQQAITSVLKDKPFSFAELDEYLEVIRWDFGRQEQAALMKFYTLAKEMKLLARAPEITLAKVF